MDAALTREPLPPRPPDNNGAGAMLALAVHIGLVLALAAGVNWRQRQTETFSAEIWAALPERAAPRETAPPPTPAPAPEPAPPPKLAPPPPPPAPTAADIALERAKVRAAEQEREQREELERQRAIERERLAEAKRQREAEAALLKQQRELQRKREQELARKAEEARRKAEEARRTAALEAQRKENLQRMLGQAGATGSPSSTGTAARDAGPSASYGGKIRASILPNIVLTETLPATLEAEVEVRAAPSGTILSRRLVKSSGNATWDDAVLRAIDRTGKLPRDTDGRVPASIVISFRPE